MVLICFLYERIKRNQINNVTNCMYVQYIPSLRPVLFLISIKATNHIELCWKIFYDSVITFTLKKHYHLYSQSINFQYNLVHYWKLMFECAFEDHFTLYSDLIHSMFFIAASKWFGDILDRPLWFYCVIKTYLKSRVTYYAQADDIHY